MDTPSIRARRTACIGGILVVFAALIPVMAQPMVDASEGKTWIIDDSAETTGKLDMSLVVSPRPLVYGRVIDATIEVSNGSNTDRTVELKAMLGEVAHFVGGDYGVRFEHPEQAEQERRIFWPPLDLPAGKRGQVSFQFLVTWDVLGDVYLEVESLDPVSGEGPQVAHVREPPQYPAGGGGFLARYGFMVVLAIFGMLGMIALNRRMKSRQPGAGGGLGRILALAGSALLILVSGLMLWGSLEPMLNWKETTCDVLDVRYSVDTTTSSSTTAGQQSTYYSYTPSLTLRYDVPGGPMISSGYRSQSTVSDIGDLEPFAAGTTIECYYDPDDPAWVVVFLDLEMSTIIWVTIQMLIALVLIWLGVRRSAKTD